LDIGGIVLAGGKGIRLREDKALETISKRTLLEQVVFRLSLLDGDIPIVIVSERRYPQLAGYPRLRIAGDIYPGKGPLGGIYSGLKASDSFYNLVVACDMPFLNRDLLLYMVEAATGFDLVVPRLGNLIEPLHAVYTKDCLAPIERLLEKDSLSVRGLFPMVRVRYVEAEEIERFDPEHLSFFNVNTGADLERARGLIERFGG
jgi:molybdopterin-guanine dinucleotide biosynthesis protein A